MAALLSDPSVQEGLFGFGITNLDMGLVAYEPTLNAFLTEYGVPFTIPNFTAGRASAEAFDIYTGSMDFISVAGRNLEIKYNTGKKWNIPGILEFGPAVIDWAASFPAVTDDPATTDVDETRALGYEVISGGSPVILNYDGNERKGVTLEYALVSLFDFMHLEGSMGFEMGPQMLVDISTGVQPNLKPLFQSTVGDAFNALPEEVRGSTAITNNGGTITDLDVSGWMIGGDGLSAYIGTDLSTADIEIPDSDNTSARPLATLLSNPSVQQGLFGFGISNVDVGLVAYEPTLNDFLAEYAPFTIPNFTALRANANAFDIYTGSMDFIRVAGRKLELKLNDGDKWNIPGLPILGSAVINWAASFPALEDDAATTNVDETRALGYEVITGGDPVILDYSSKCKGVTLEYALVSLFDFIHLEGSMAF
jgi:hypothetical protein